MADAADDKGGTKEESAKKDGERINVKKRSSCCKCMFWTFSITIGLIACAVGFVYYKTKGVHIPETIAEHLGPEGVQLFLAYDRDGDGYMSVSEFEPLYHRFANTNRKESGENGMVSYEPSYDIPIDDDDEVVTVEAHFQPLLLETMTRDKENDYSFGFGTSATDSLYGLKMWKNPHIPVKNFGVHHFASLFKEALVQGPIGEVEPLIKTGLGLADIFSGDSTSNKFFPPFVYDEGVILHRLLTMFHERPFITTRFGPRGTCFLVRARNDQYIEIMFRMHAEFQLNRPPSNPFWFTPGQFAGNIIVSRDLKHIQHFHVYVPAEKKLNVDMEWLEGGQEMTVDIGYMPEMNLTITSPSVPAAGYQGEERVPDQTTNLADIVWKEEITNEEALRKLEVYLYKFKEVTYYNFTEALTEAQKEDRLVHSILLWGALDDQSC